MFEINLPIGEAHLDSWRSHRLFSACRAFALHFDPDMTAQAIYQDHLRQGWTFSLSTAGARDRLSTFHDQLYVGVLAERPSRLHPVDVGDRDAASAIYPY